MTVPQIPAVQRLPDSGRSGTEPNGAGATGHIPSSRENTVMTVPPHGECGHPQSASSSSPQGRGTRRFPYLDADDPDLPPLRAGDVLVVNTARATLRAHATSPAALTHYVQAGVRVLSTGESARSRPRHQPAGGRRIRRRIPQLDHRR
jgi:hypothetical protein